MSARFYVAYNRHRAIPATAVERSHFDADAVLDDYPVPVRAMSAADAARIAADWLACGADYDDIGGYQCRRTDRTCWVERSRD